MRSRAPRAPRTGIIHGHADNAGSGSTGRRLRFERNSNSTERSYPRPKRTGIIITLLPISSETAESTRRERARGAGGGRKEEQPGHSEREKESDQDASDEDTVEGRRENEARGERRGARFRSRHPVYRSAVRDAGPNGVAFLADNYH